MTFKKLLGIYPEPELILYRSFANADTARIIGRVVERTKAGAPSSLLGTAFSLIRSYIASPFRDMEVTIVSDSGSTSVRTNKNGIFETSFPFRGKIEVRLGDQSAVLDAVALSPGASFGIISNIDDTVLISNATRTIKLLYLLFTKNARSRKPFPGVSELYSALVRHDNPIFYVSSSAWSLYPLLIEFLDINRIPKGPLLLKELGGVRTIFSAAGQHGHKADRIEMILAMHPGLPFILIGDSGQKDAEIYSAVALRHPDRIKAIYIRDVTVREDMLVKRAIETLEGKVDMVLVKTSEEAAAHALQKGFIVKKEEKRVKEGADQEA